MIFIEKIYRAGRLSRWLLFVSICFLILAYFSFRETSAEKFFQGCLEGQSKPTAEQCHCLTNYVFENLESMQVVAIMEPHRIRSDDEMERIQRVLQEGTRKCGW